MSLSEFFDKLELRLPQPVQYPLGCPVCGFGNKAEAKYCRSCGTNFFGEKAILAPSRQLAALIGVNKYTDYNISDLNFCVNDVMSIHNILKQGYEDILLLTDNEYSHNVPTRNDTIEAIHTIAQMADKNDSILFYFSGHGVLVDGKSYLLLRDSKMLTVKYTALCIEDVFNIMNESEARVKMIILDACYSGASIGKTPLSLTREFIKNSYIDAEGYAILASCKQGQQSWEYLDKNLSIFTYFLLEAMQGRADGDGKGFVTISDVNRYVTFQLRKWSIDKSLPQIPTLQSTTSGDIILCYYEDDNIK